VEESAGALYVRCCNRTLHHQSVARSRLCQILSCGMDWLGSDRDQLTATALSFTEGSPI
jgi:hypothetical protein